MPHSHALARFRPLLRRLYWAVTPAVHGRPRPDDMCDAAAAVPFDFDVPNGPDGQRVAVVCHLFYDDLAGAIRNTLERIPFPTDVFISTNADDKAERIRGIFDGFAYGAVDVRVAPNRGRDISHKLVTFRDVYPRYAYVLFVHGKKSAPSSVGQQWFDTMLDSLVGSPEVVRSIMQIFVRHPQIGIVMAQHFEGIRDHLHWDHTFTMARRLARQMGFDLGRRDILDFPSGSMFWARTAALMPLLSLGLTAQDFPVETGQGRRTLHHTIERLFLYVAERAGFRWVKVAAPQHYAITPDIRPITSVAALDAFVADAGSFSLIPSSRTDAS